jgi:hypothetical protein
VIQQASVDASPLPRRHAEGAIAGLHLAVRIQQRRGQLIRGAYAADPAQIGPEPGTTAVDAVTGETLALAREQRGAARRVTARGGIRRDRPTAQIGDDLRGLFPAHVRAGGHRGARDALDDDVQQLVVRIGLAEHAVSQIDVGDLIACPAVAVGAKALERLLTAEHVCAGFVLGKGDSAEQQQQQGEKWAGSHRPECTTEAFRPGPCPGTLP